MKKISYFLAILLLSTGVSAQVTIGSGDVPQDYSVLELISNNERGLRLPQMTTAQHNALIPTLKGDALAEGLQVFNTDTKVYRNLERHTLAFCLRQCRCAKYS